MQRRSPSTLRPAALAVAALCWPMACLADSALTVDVASVACTLTTPGGTSSVPCGSATWSGTLEPGWSLGMTVGLNYHYIDDGLALPMPRYIQTDSLGGGQFATHEAAAYYYSVVPTCGRYCPTLPPALAWHSDMPGWNGGMVLFLSNNDHPDDIGGSATLELTATWPTNYFGPWSGAVGFMLYEGPIYSVNAVPEPSTWALFAVSLAALALVLRRRAPEDVGHGLLAKPASGSDMGCT